MAWWCSSTTPASGRRAWIGPRSPATRAPARSCSSAHARRLSLWLIPSWSPLLRTRAARSSPCRCARRSARRVLPSMPSPPRPSAMPDTHFYRYDDYDRALVAERVEQFRNQVRRRLAGELTEEQFKPLRLTNGLYLQLH